MQLTCCKNVLSGVNRIVFRQRKPSNINSYLYENYKCLLFVRADENNSYFNTLKNSGIWEAYCGNEAYEKIKIHSGYDLKLWTDSNIDWANDFNAETITHFSDSNLLQYLLW